MDMVTYALCKKYTGKEIEKIISSFSEGMSFKGTVDSIADLPASATAGDLYVLKADKCKAVYYNNEWTLFDDVPEKISDLTDDIGLAEKSWVESAKQNTLTAGDGISIKGDVISASPIGKSFYLGANVGLLRKGSMIDAEDSLSDILLKILYGGESDEAINIYYGASAGVPVNINGLKHVSGYDVDELLANGLTFTIPTGTSDSAGQHPQYPVFACDKGAASIKLDRWTSSGIVSLPFISLYEDDPAVPYSLYYLNSQTYDPEGAQYTFTFKKGS